MKSTDPANPTEKPKRFFLGIQFKAMSLIVCILVLTAFIMVNFLSYRTRELIWRHALERLEAVTSSFTFDAEYGLLVHDVHTLDKLAQSVEAQKDILHALVFDKNGNLVSSPPRGIRPEEIAEIKESFEKKKATTSGNKYVRYEDRLPSLGEIHVIGNLIYSEKKESAEELGLFNKEVSKEIIGYGILIYSGEGIRLEIQKVQNEIIFIHSTLAVVILLLIFILATFFIKGLRRLQQTAQKIGKGEFATRVIIKSRDELEELGNSINRMAENLEKITVSRDSLLKEIEERKRLENIVLQSEKMAAVGQLAGGVAHEINNPLGVILGFAQGVVKRLTPADPLEMPLKSIEREALRCKGLVQDLLTFSRTGKTEKEEMDLNETIESALSLILAQSKVKNTQLIKELEPNLPKILANKNQIQQVIINLSNNAMDAMPDGGKLTIRTKKAKLNDKDAVEIQVQDTGQGIPKEIQQKIFEPFFTTKEVGKGTGLGLSLVYEIVQRYEGTITVNSEVGRGTVFSVVLGGVYKL